MTKSEKVAPRLLLDEKIWARLASNLRARGFDVVHKIEVKPDTRLDDEDILELASEDGRAILTHNARHFAPLFKQWFELGKQHAGIIISDQLPKSELQRRVEKLLRSLSAEELKNTITYLQNYK